ncbi:HutD/Ves family protein [Oryzifoliimicrobium ureilyticus]|uniref:HutD/Ves family protein n=1 Tax=Oryzifoliimicrobium ureilyticus TaxID=3113724 RepID=UPI0030763477
MELRRACDHKHMPWKNGKGETVEIAVFPSNAAIGDFGWRVSTASVDTDGPFSLFDDIDRTLSVIEGQGIKLSVAGADPISLNIGSQPFSFPGDVQTSASLLNGPIKDLNIMTRRGRFSHRVKKVEGLQQISFDQTAEVTILLALSAARIDERELGPLDAAIFQSISFKEHVLVEASGNFFRIDIFAVR